MLKQPVGMKVYTNVSIVRLKLGKGTFEIACYPNKVQDYRYKKEKDMKEVLQTREIFKNAIKGDLVPQKELKEVFPNMTKDDILKLILEKGAIQTGEKERETESSNLKKNIAFIIVEKTYNKNTGLPFPQDLIIKVLNEIEFKIIDKENAKKQALKAIKEIQEKNILPLERRLMLLLITLKNDNNNNFEEFCNKFMNYLKTIEAEILDNEIKNKENFSVKCKIKPYFYRELLKQYEKLLNIEILSQNEISSNIKKEDDNNNNINNINNNNNNEPELRIASSNVEQYLEENFKEENKNKKKKLLHCTKCKGSSFEKQEDLRAHSKTNWHKHNAILSAKGEQSLSAEEYDDYVLMHPEELK